MKTREEMLKEMNRFRRQMLNAEQSEIVKRGVHEILNAPTQEQTKCKYCHGEVDLNDTANSSFQLNLDMEDECDPRLAVTYEDEFHDYDSVSISYCPCCGRKLGE